MCMKLSHLPILHLAMKHKMPTILKSRYTTWIFLQSFNTGIINSFHTSWRFLLPQSTIKSRDHNLSSMYLWTPLPSWNFSKTHWGKKRQIEHTRMHQECGYKKVRRIRNQKPVSICLYFLLNVHLCIRKSK